MDIHVYKHRVIRATSTSDAEQRLDESYSEGYQLVSASSGGGDSNVLWLVMQRMEKKRTETAHVDPPEPAAPTGLIPTR